MALRIRNKYRAKRCEIDGIKFDSQLEGRRYCELKLLEKAGCIRDLRVHPRFALKCGEVTIGHYEADFDYQDASGEYHVEDCKGFITQLSRWKIRHFELQYGRQVEIVRMVR